MWIHVAWWGMDHPKRLLLVLNLGSSNSGLINFNVQFDVRRTDAWSRLPLWWMTVNRRGLKSHCLLRFVARCPVQRSTREQDFSIFPRDYDNFPFFFFVVTTDLEPTHICSEMHVRPRHFKQLQRHCFLLVGPQSISRLHPRTSLCYSNTSVQSSTSGSVQVRFSSSGFTFYPTISHPIWCMILMAASIRSWHTSSSLQLRDNDLAARSFEFAPAIFLQPCVWIFSIWSVGFSHFQKKGTRTGLAGLCF